MNQGLPKGWSIEGLTIEGLSPEAFVIVAIATGLIAVAAVAVLAIMLWRSRHQVPAEDPAMVALRNAQAEAAARLEAMIGMLAKGQTQLAHTVNERLDFGLASAGRFAREDQAEHNRESAEARRAPRGHRPRAEKHHRARRSGDDAARRARQQADARRVRPMAHGSHRPGRPAQRDLRLPAHARQQDPPRLLCVSARPPSAGDRCKISARSFHRLSGRQDRRGTQSRGRAAARRRRQARGGYCAEISDPRRDPRNRFYVCAFGIDLCRAA